jgi:NAD-dependent SIR2 family protein deacetylase
MKSRQRLTNESKKAIHGHACDAKWPAPLLVAESNEACRKDQGNHIKANEYMDEPEVLQQKIKIIAQLIRKSKFTVAYTGAGLSKASGIPDYATKSSNTVVNAPKITSSLDAVPTYAHCVITAMERKGFIDYYVQQNHDGLPQKSGFPQEKMNEIHGAWFDPSNPVVKFGGNLRDDLFSAMLKVEKKIDLCLCLGTSLSGMNADRMANTPAKKMLQRKALGTIIINLQKTPLDDKSAIRVWAKLDDAFKLLVKELEIDENVIARLPRHGYKLSKYNDVFTLPYDTNGCFSKRERLTLDLRQGAKVRICAPGAVNENALGTIVGKKHGDWLVEIEEVARVARRVFGKWWIEAALRGAITQLPLVNQNPIVKTVRKNTMETIGIDSTDIPVMIQIVQSYEVKEQDEHHWTIRVVDGCISYVSKVTYRLDPTLNDPVRTVREAPFELACVGLETFNIDVQITLKNGTKLNTIHLLSFENKGNNVAFTNIPINWD